MVGRAWLTARTPATPRARAAWLAAAAAGLALVYYLHAADAKLLGDFTWILVPLAMAVVMFALVSRAPAAGRILLANAPIAFVGRVSYSAYLYHLPLLLAWNKFGPGEFSWGGFPAYVALVLAVAWLSFRAIELPFMRSSRSQKGPTWPNDAAPGASEAPRTSPTTIANGAVPSTTTGSSSSS